MLFTPVFCCVVAGIKTPGLMFNDFGSSSQAWIATRAVMFCDYDSVLPGIDDWRSNGTSCFSIMLV
jgi:hypothetical protein